MCLFCHMTLYDHLTEESCEFIGGNLRGMSPPLWLAIVIVLVEIKSF